MKLGLLLKAIRLPLFVGSIIPVAMTAAYVRRFSWPLLVQVLIGVVMVQAAINLLMDFYDIQLGRPLLNLDTAFPLGPILHREFGVSSTTIRNAAGALILAAVVVGAALQLEVGGYMIPLYAALGLAAALAYILPPLSLARRGIGEPMTFVAFGPLAMLGTYYVLAREFSAQVLIASAGVGGLAAATRFIHHSPENPPGGFRDRHLAAIYSAIVLASMAFYTWYSPSLLQLIPWALSAVHLLRVRSAVRSGGALAASRLTYEIVVIYVIVAVTSSIGYLAPHLAG